MSPSLDESLPPEEPVDAVISAWLEAAEHGTALDPVELIAAHPDFAEELREFFNGHFRIQGLFEPCMPSTKLDVPAAASALEPDTLPPASVAVAEAATIPPDRMIPAIHSGPPVGTNVRYFGDYELLQEIARGGMGVVYKARQVNLNRLVALKMILSGQLAGPDDVKRFYIEAEAAAHLDHPGIVPIFEVGQHDGQHFFSMGFVEGQSLSALVAKGPLPPREAVSLVRDIARAVDYAHKKGVIHRDLKPGNILLDADGKPRVTDFGLAKLTSSDSELTGTGQILGTPSYMPPEQASGHMASIGPAVDVYALGAILYCLLTGRPPFQAANAMDTLLQVIGQDPVSLKLLNPQTPNDLETITLKCLNKDQNKRYGSAHDLAEELQRFLDGRPILARPAGITERLWRWCRRNPSVASLTGVAALTLILGASISTYFAIAERQRAISESNAKQLADEQTKIAEANAERADQNAEKARQNAEQESIARIRSERQLRIATAERLAAVSMLQRPSAPNRGLVLAIESGRATVKDDEGLSSSSLQALAEALNVIGGHPLEGHHNAITGVAVSPDQRWIVTASDENVAKLWEMNSGNVITPPSDLVGHTGAITSVAISSDSHRAVTGSHDGTARVWDLTAENPSISVQVLKGHQRRISNVLVSPDDRWILTASDDGTVRVWDMASDVPDLSPRVLVHGSPIFHIAISPDSRWLAAAAGDDPVIRVWDLTTDDSDANPLLLKMRLQGFTKSTSKVVFSADSRKVFASTGFNILSTEMKSPVLAWEVTADHSAADPTLMHGHRIGIFEMVASPNGRWLVTTGKDSSIRVWDQKAKDANAESRLLPGQNDLVTCVAISPDSRWLVTGGGISDIVANVWDLSDVAVKPRQLVGHESPLTKIAFSADSRWIVTGSQDTTCRLWDLSGNLSSNPRLIPTRHKSNVGDVKIDQSGRWLISTSQDGVKISDLKSPKLVEQPVVALKEMQNKTLNVGGRWSESDEPGQLNRCSALSADNRWLVTGGPNAVKLWDLEAAKPLEKPRSLDASANVLLSVTMTGDNGKVFAGCVNGTIQVWDLSSTDAILKPQTLNSPNRSIGSVDHLRVSQNQRWLVGGGGQSALLWDLSSENTATMGQVFEGHRGVVACLAISSDNHWVAAGGAGFEGGLHGIATVWDLTAQNPLVPYYHLNGHSGHVSSLAFGPEGKWIATGSFDGTARIWNLSSPDSVVSPQVLTGHQSQIRCLTTSSDGRWLVTGSLDRTVRVWDLHAEKPSANPIVLGGIASEVQSVTISADGSSIVAGLENGTVCIWKWKWDDLVELAGRVGRNLNQADWERQFPGQDYRRTFSNRVIPGELLTAADYYEQGRHFLAAAEFQNAVKDFSEAARLTPTVPIYREALGEAFLRDGQFQPAIDSLNLASQLSQTNETGSIVRRLAWLAIAYQKLGQDAKALEHLGRFRRLMRNPSLRDDEVLQRLQVEADWTVLTSQYRWTPLVPVTMSAASGAVMTRLDDQSVLVSGPTPGSERYQIEGSVELPRISTLRIDALRDASLPNGGPGRSGNGNFVLTGIELIVTEGNEQLKKAPCRIREAIVDFVQSGHDPHDVVDGASPTGWAILRPDGRTLEQAIVFELEQPVSLVTGSKLTVVLKCESPWGGHHLGRFRISVSGNDKKQIEKLRMSDVRRNRLPRIPHAAQSRLAGHSGPVTSVAYSPDGKWIATSSDDHTIRLWEAGSEVFVRELAGHTDHVRCVAFSPDSQMLASGSFDKTIGLWNPANGERVGMLQDTVQIRSLAFAPDGATLVSGRMDKNSRVWNVAERKLVRELIGHVAAAWAVAVSPNGKLIATGGQDPRLRLWNASDGGIREQFIGHWNSINSLAFSPDGQFLASAGGGEERQVILWNSRAEARIFSITEHGGIVHGVAFSRDSQLLASASGEGLVRLWDTKTGKLQSTLAGGGLSIAFSSDGKRLASGGADGIVSIWDLEAVRTSAGVGE